MADKMVDPEQPPPPYGGVDPAPQSTYQPPHYDDVSDPPPSYASLFGEIREAHDKSSSVLEFLKKFVMIIVGTIGCTACLAIFLAIPISAIVIGVEYKDDCPIQPKIPLYLIVLGSFGILRNLIGLWNQVKRRLSEAEGEEETDVKKSTCEGLIDCFMIAWFICGNVWVYSNYKPDFDDVASSQYCHEVVYMFAFWLNTASYILMGVMCCCMCCVACCSLLVGGN